jgi:hypothetical protein
MHSALIYLTKAPTKIGLAGARQLIQNAVDVSGYQHITLLLEILALTGTTPTAEIVITTGMQLDTEDGWVELGTFGSKNIDGAWKLNMSDALRYIRWEVKALGGTSPLVTFLISGVGRG